MKCIPLWPLSYTVVGENMTDVIKVIIIIISVPGKLKKIQ